MHEVSHFQILLLRLQ